MDGIETNFISGGTTVTGLSAATVSSFLEVDLFANDEESDGSSVESKLSNKVPSSISTR